VKITAELLQSIQQHLIRDKFEVLSVKKHGHGIISTSKCVCSGVECPYKKKNNKVYNWWYYSSDKILQLSAPNLKIKNLQKHINLRDI